MRITPKSAFALASVLTLSLVACAGDEGDVANDDADDAAAETDDGADNGAEGSGEDSEDDAAAISSVDELVIGLVPSTDEDVIVDNADGIAEQLSEELDGFPVTIDVFD